MKRTNVPQWLSLAAILCIAFCLRIWGTNTIPVGITSDELDYYLGGKFIALTGSDFTDNWKWWQFKPMITATYTAETTALMYAPIAGMLPSSLLTAKLTTALIGTLTVYILFLIAQTLANTNVGLLAAATLALNPWHVVFSRTTFEVIIALFWLTLSLYLYLKHNNLGTTKATWLRDNTGALIALVLGYYSYHGFKFIVLPIAIILATFGYKRHASDANKIRGGIIISLALLLLIRSLLTPTITQRSNELLTPQSSAIASLVDAHRKLAPVKSLANLVSNKFVFTGKAMVSNYLAFFSPNKLFTSASDNVNLNFDVHGYFYLLEIMPLLVGIYIASKHKKYWMLLALLLISPLPSTIHQNQSYAIRSQFAIIPLSILIALGWQSILSWSSKFRIPILLWPILMIVSVTYGIYQYTNSFSIRSADQYMLQHRLVSKYLNNAPPNSKITVITQEPYQVFRSYLFYANAINRDNIAYLQAQFRQQGIWGEYRLDHILITSNCRLANEYTLIIDERIKDKCGWRQHDGPAISLGSPIDSRTYYSLYGDSLCQDSSSYIHIDDLSLLNIENLSNTQFCHRWTYRT